MQKMHMLHAKKAIDSLKKELAAERKKLDEADAESGEVLAEINTLENEKNEEKTGRLKDALQSKQAEAEKLRELLAAEEKKTARAREAQEKAKAAVESANKAKAKGAALLATLSPSKVNTSNTGTPKPDSAKQAGSLAARRGPATAKPTPTPTPTPTQPASSGSPKDKKHHKNKKKGAAAKSALQFEPEPEPEQAATAETGLLAGGKTLQLGVALALLLAVGAALLMNSA